MKYPVVILHGWKKEGKDYNEIQKILEKEGYDVFAPDLPGFGNEKLQKDPMTVNDYVNFVMSFLHKKSIKKAIFICHSFGGRVGIKLAVAHPDVFSHLILTGVPGIRQPLSFKKKIISNFSVVVKKILKDNDFARKILYRLLHEMDYYYAEDMRNTFLVVINEDLKKYLSQIHVPTTLIWGGIDMFVPTWIAKNMKNSIKDATYIEIPNTTHKLPYERPELFIKQVLSVINK